MTRRQICWMVVVLVAVAAAGCGGTTTGTDSGTGTTMTSGTTPGGSGPRGTAGSNGLTGTSWLLSTYQGSGGNQTPAAAGETSSLEFGAGEVLTGNTGCNQFTGTYRVTGIDLKITLGPMTRRACTDADLTAQEAALTQLLPTVTTYRKPPSGLTLMAGDAVVAAYKPGVSSLEGTSWTVTGVNNGRGGVEANALTPTLSATFGPNAEFSGTACNNLTGEYHTTGTDGLVIGRLATTMMACPPEKMELEKQYVNALDQVRTYRISGDTMTMRDSGGATQVTLVLKP